MTKDPGDILLRRYLQGKCTRTEQLQVERWLEEDSSHADRLEHFAARNTPLLSIEEEHIKAEVMQYIGDEVTSEADQSEILGIRKTTNTYSHRKFTAKWGAAAAVILLIFSTCLGMYLLQKQTPEQKIAYAERTLPPGKTAIFTLSDGSKVHLNSESRLKFPEEFGKESRKIYLDGEAYFNVAPDEDRPFEVYTGSIKTTVLGTAFNVKAFPGERQTQIAVKHGKVAVEKEDSANTSLLLTPNQWATFDKDRREFQKESGDIRPIVAWKDRILYFNNKTVAEVANMLERWYGKEIMVKNQALKSCVLQGEHKEESLENVLEAMKFALNMDYKFTGEGVIITGGSCK